MVCKSGEVMARIRRELGKTQEELGEALGISKQRVSALERGATEMSLPMAVRVCEALEGLSCGRRSVTLDELAGLEPRMGTVSLPERVRGPMEALIEALGTEVAHVEEARRGQREGREGQEGRVAAALD